MGYFVTKQTDSTTLYVNEIIADTVADLDQIDIRSMAPGSTCIITQEGDPLVYILDSNKKWVKMG